jgi:hypothetical protein
MAINFNFPDQYRDFSGNFETVLLCKFHGLFSLFDRFDIED